ncbi:DUF805 domain-containing protein [Algisphaera agarilytica]|uniref:Tetratricopeptide repeat protein n=1 Tax=Algisphaera agarilytica TaxID=1385975 RepID=A0A7X0LL59_9BACT|nr:DUF805 domain-containing protein [Algisphaera agarilytica]MBB6430667.1 hypothetical protein [Algisphaera agarilytica]
MNAMVEFFLLALLAAVIGLVFATIFRKAGYSPWWGALMFVPVVNLIWLIYFATSDWPILRELVFRRMDLGDASAEDNRTLIRAAYALEQQKRWEEAVRVYTAIAEHPELASAEYAANCAQRLKERIALHQGDA